MVHGIFQSTGLSATFEVGGASARVGGEIDYFVIGIIIAQNVLNCEKVGGPIDKSRRGFMTPPPIMIF